MANYKITLLKGDGIGPEIVNQAVKRRSLISPLSTTRLYSAAARSTPQAFRFPRKP